MCSEYWYISSLRSLIHSFIYLFPMFSFFVNCPWRYMKFNWRFSSRNTWKGILANFLSEPFIQYTWQVCHSLFNAFSYITVSKLYKCGQVWLLRIWSNHLNRLSLILSSLWANYTFNRIWPFISLNDIGQGQS